MVIFVALVCLLAHHALAITELTDANFYDYAKEKDVLLVNFYAPWCGDCKNLAPDLETAASTLGTRGLDLAKVDCFGAGKGLCDTYGIKRWPTLKNFNRGSYTGDYNGGLTSNEIAGYIATVENSIAPANPYAMAIPPPVTQACMAKCHIAKITNKQPCYSKCKTKNFATHNGVRKLAPVKFSPPKPIINEHSCAKCRIPQPPGKLRHRHIHATSFKKKGRINARKGAKKSVVDQPGKNSGESKRGDDASKRGNDSSNRSNDAAKRGDDDASKEQAAMRLNEEKPFIVVDVPSEHTQRHIDAPSASEQQQRHTSASENTTSNIDLLQTDTQTTTGKPQHTDIVEKDSKKENRTKADEITSTATKEVDSELKKAKANDRFAGDENVQTEILDVIDDGVHAKTKVRSSSYTSDENRDISMVEIVEDGANGISTKPKPNNVNVKETTKPPESAKLKSREVRKPRVGTGKHHAAKINLFDVMSPAQAMKLPYSLDDRKAKVYKSKQRPELFVSRKRYRIRHRSRTG